MRNLRNNLYPFEGRSHGKVASMLAVLAIVAPFSTEKVSAESLQTPASVASEITKTIHEKLPVAIDAEEQLGWSPAGSYCYMKYVTDVEISRNINGVKEYFQLKQTGDTLDSVIAEPINAVREISTLSPFVLEYGSAATTVGVISLDAHNQPVTEVQYYNNAQAEIVSTPVGVTTPMGC